jgi:hypothetical protein
MTNNDHLKHGPAGWQPLLHELDTMLQTRWPDYTILQVKEKFGTLRFYAEPGIKPPDFDDGAEGTAAHNQWYTDNVDAFHDLIHQYEHKSASICELCGQPGKLGNSGYWWATRCAGCAPAGWVAEDVRCDHPTITDGTCDTCGRQRLTRLEHTDQVLVNVHPDGTCAGERCTIHNRSDHAMRAFPQRWRSDRALMERICPHGVGHPDPDDWKVTGADAAVESVHGCDGCCTGGAQ